MRAATLDLPHDRHYDRGTHVWARRDEGTGRVRVGVDAIGLEWLGELAYVGLRAEDTVVVRGEPLGSLEAAKMTTAIAAPVSGMIIARNRAVLADPLAVNRDPHGAGWLVELEPTDWAREAALLVAGNAIDAWAKAEVERLRREDEEEAGHAEHAHG
jgi:glycine cleavage system H protein